MADRDIAGIVAQADLPAIASAYVELKKRGKEYVCLCPFHADNDPSMSIFHKGGKWQFYCFPCGEGGDALDWIMKLEGLDTNGALEKLTGGTFQKVAKLPVRDVQPLPDRVTSKPPTDAGEPKMHIRDLGDPVKAWAYRDAAGELLGYAARYDTADGKKEFRCWTWGARGDAAPGWGCGHWSKPRPLYGLDRLAARTGAPVLIVEGEKAADRAQELLGQYVVVTWPGGAKAWKHADLNSLRNRRVDLWPDNDAPGIEAMEGLLAILSDKRGLACYGKIIDPSGMTEGFDAADWPGTSAELIAWLRTRATEYPKYPEHEAPAGTDPALPPDEPAGPDLPPLEAYAEEGARHQDPAPQHIKPKINGQNIVGEVFYRSMSQIQSKSINWLWPGRFAKGKVSMIVGNPGLGKSQVCSSLVSVVSNGGHWPVDRARCDRGSVVMLSAEDDPEDTIRPRLEAAGADLDRVYILDAIRVERPEGEGKRGFDLGADVTRLEALLREVGEPALVIIDPITAYLGDADSHKNAEVRALLAPLSDMASRLGVAVIVVSHLTKSSGMDALLRVQGSIGFAAAARAVWGVAKDKDNPQRRLFMPLKNNLGTDNTGFAYTVEGVRLPESDIETSHIMWENQIITQSADEIFGGDEQTREEQGAIFEAKQFLRGLLANGPLDSRAIELDARGAGHSMTTVRRAAKELNLRIAKDGFGKGAPWKWHPPEDSVGHR